MRLEDFVRSDVRKLSLYKVKEIPQKGINLHLNENYFVSHFMVNKLLRSVCRDIDVRLYPQPYSSSAAKSVSTFLGFSEDEVAIGNGADDVLDLIMKVFLKTTSTVLVVEPTFPMYTYFIQLYGGTKVDVMLKPNFALDVDEILTKDAADVSLLFLCSPNNPTGNQFKKDDIKQLLQEFKGIVVVDEAYVDFAKYTVIDWVREFTNLIVVRSFSKSFGLAGVRFGFLVADKAIVEYVKRVTPPFNVNVITHQLISHALDNWSYFEKQIVAIKKERKWLEHHLREVDGILPYPSETNFLLFKVVKDALSSSTVTKRLEGDGIFVKDRGAFPLLENCIRVTIGTRRMNEGFLSALKDALEE